MLSFTRALIFSSVCPIVLIEDWHTTLVSHVNTRKPVMSVFWNQCQCCNVSDATPISSYCHLICQLFFFPQMTDTFEICT